MIGIVRLLDLKGLLQYCITGEDLRGPNVVLFQFPFSLVRSIGGEDKSKTLTAAV